MNEERQDLMNESGAVRDPELNALLRDFRSAVTHVSLRQIEQQRNEVPGGLLAMARRRERRKLAISWSAGGALVCAAVLCLIFLPASSHAPQTASGASNVAAAAPQNPSSPDAQAAPVAESGAPLAPDADSSLLEAVDTDVSASVPPSLAPLAEMENWAASSAGTPGESAANGSTAYSTESADAAH